MIALGKEIKSFRKSLHLSLTTLGKRLGASKSMMSAYESGVSTPSTDIIVSTANVFHVTTDYLLGREKRKLIDISGLTEGQETAVRKTILEFEAANQLK